MPGTSSVGDSFTPRWPLDEEFATHRFDCPQIDTLFLTFPVSFKGKLVQYVGRLMRSHEGKRVVRVYDYADVHVPVLKKMYQKRRKTYETLGFSTEEVLQPKASNLFVEHKA